MNQGSRKLFLWWFRVKMEKKLKLHWLKRSKTTPKNEISIRKQMIQNLLFGVVYLLLLDFLVESKPRKTSNKDHSFYNTVSLQKHNSFYESQLTQHSTNKILPQ